ncbi:MAG TPA: hypothetical protein VLO07_07770 [Thermoanaerobaculia bacterium]|nr:hypothetical protein [Thermoanaerobaculia bacterium]
MPEITSPSTVYEVSVDRGSLTAMNLGEDGTGYAVQLGGELNAHWARCYSVMRVHSPSYVRFHLDTEKKIVWFACRADDRPAKITPVIEMLEALVKLTNERAETEAWEELEKR